MFANLFGNTLLGAMDAGLDLTNAYVTVGKNGSVGFTTWESFTKGDESDLDAKLKLASKITEQYVKDYHDESMSDIMFQRKHNDYVATLSYVLLNQIYGESYISKEYLPVV